MTEAGHTGFDLSNFLETAGLGPRLVQVKPKHIFFAQGELADSVFYLLAGRAKLTVRSGNGKEAILTLLSAGDFVGEESLAGVVGRRIASATANEQTGFGKEVFTISLQQGTVLVSDLNARTYFRKRASVQWIAGMPVAQVAHSVSISFGYAPKM